MKALPLALFLFIAPTLGIAQDGHVSIYKLLDTIEQTAVKNFIYLQGDKAPLPSKITGLKDSPFFNQWVDFCERQTKGRRFSIAYYYNDLHTEEYAIIAIGNDSTTKYFSYEDQKFSTVAIGSVQGYNHLSHIGKQLALTGDGYSSDLFIYVSVDQGAITNVVVDHSATSIDFDIVSRILHNYIEKE